VPTGHLPELFIVLVIALIVFGPQRLPEVSSSLGKALREFRRATSELQESVLHQVEPEPEDVFPHIPPAPDTGVTTDITPTIDTLAQRREARKAAREAAKPAGNAATPTGEAAKRAPARPRAVKAVPATTPTTPRQADDENAESGG